MKLTRDRNAVVERDAALQAKDDNLAMLRQVEAELGSWKSCIAVAGEHEARAAAAEGEAASLREQLEAAKAAGSADDSASAERMSELESKLQDTMDIAALAYVSNLTQRALDCGFTKDEIIECYDSDEPEATKRQIISLLLSHQRSQLTADKVGLESKPAEAEAEAEAEPEPEPEPMPEAHTPPSQRSHQACVIRELDVEEELDLEETVSTVCDAPGSPMHKGAPQRTRALCCVGGEC
jgi:hypothetical protein